MKHTATWKAHERRTAKVLGGKRLGATGQANPDVEAGWVVAECKHHKRLAAWVTSPLSRIRGQAGGARLGITVHHEEGAADSVVMLSLKDWRDWFGNLPVNWHDQPDDARPIPF